MRMCQSNRLVDVNGRETAAELDVVRMRMRHICILLYYIKSARSWYPVCIMSVHKNAIEESESMRVTAMLLCPRYTNAHLLARLFIPSLLRSVHSIVFYIYFVDFFFVIVVVSIIHILRLYACTRTISLSTS